MVAITGVEDVGKGLIREGTGYVTFPVKYQCVVFRPFKGEILEAVVTMVNKVGDVPPSLAGLVFGVGWIRACLWLVTPIRLRVGSADGVLRGGWACADLRVQPCECLLCLELLFLMLLICAVKHLC